MAAVPRGPRGHVPSNAPSSMVTLSQRTLYNFHYTVRYTLYATHYTLYTVRCTLYAVHSTLHTVRHALYSTHCTLHTVRYTLYATHYTLHTVRYTLYAVLGEFSAPSCAVGWQGRGGQRGFHLLPQSNPEITPPLGRVAHSPPPQGWIYGRFLGLDLQG